MPRTVDRAEIDLAPRRMEELLRSFPWIKDVEVRMREEGHVYFREAFVVTEHGELAEQLDAAMR